MVRLVEQADRRYGIVRRFWLCDFVVQHADGRSERVRRVSPTPTQRGAEAYERRVREELEKPASLPSPTLRRFVVDRWWPVYPRAAGNRPATIREKAIHLEVHLLPALGDLPLADVGGEPTDRLVASLVSGGKHPKTIRNVLTTLKTILATAVAWQVLPVMPKIRLPRIPERATDFYGRDESARLVAGATSDVDRALLLFALQTGARAGEQLALRWSDLASGNVTFSSSFTRDECGPTKSGRVRSVPMTKHLIAALDEIQHARGDFVFDDGAGGPLRLQDLHRVLARAAARATVRRLRWHDLRHSFASRLAMAGVPLRQIQEWLGHSTIAMTMRYAHLAPSWTTPAVEVLAVAPTPPLLAASA